MSRVIAFDVTRLFIGPWFETPRGVDRVDLALAKYIFDDPGTANLAVMPTPWGVRSYPAATARVLLARLQQLWSEQVEPHSDRQLADLIVRMRSGTCVRTPARPASVPLWRKVARIGRMVQHTGLPLGKPVRSSIPRDAIYLNIGQLGLAVPPFHAWLADRPDVACALMLHDVIPLEFPELVSDSLVAHHDRMVRTTATFADCLIFNTESARAGIELELQSYGRHSLPGLVRKLPLQSAFVDAVPPPAELATLTYFLTVSTIETRKNHGLLIELWLRLAEQLGQKTPHLVIVGSLGHGAEDILAPLAGHPLLSRRVHIVSGLSSPALASLMLGAAALLSPSRTEGFGLPVLEANALGVPTVASAIGAHREVANGETVLLEPDDVDGWTKVVTALLKTAGRKKRNRPAIDPALTEHAYCRDVLDFVAAIRPRDRCGPGFRQPWLLPRSR